MTTPEVERERNVEKNIYKLKYTTTPEVFLPHNNLSCCVAERINDVNKIELLVIHNFDYNIIFVLSLPTQICLLPTLQLL